MKSTTPRKYMVQNDRYDECSSQADEDKSREELINELKETRQQLQKERDFLNTVYSNSEMSVFVVSVSENGEYIYEGINPAHEKLVGYDSTKLIGKSPSALAAYVGEEVIQYVTSLYDECVSKRTTITSEYYVPNGSAKGWWLSTLTPLFDDNGRVYKLLGNGTLITKQKDLEQALKNANENLEEKVRFRTKDLLAAKNLAEEANKAKSIFLASMGHELRTPLNNIMGFSELLYRYAESDGEIKFLDIIHSSGEHLLKLINNVLDIAKLESGEITLNQDCIHIVTLVNDIVSAFSLKAEEKNVSLSFDVKDVLPECIRADELKIRQVLINLISNAIKFTQDGEVKISVDRLPSSNKQFLLRIKVSDTGEGIPQKDLIYIFKAFSQSDSGTRSKDSTGLGLFICEKLVSVMGGGIEVESQVGVGSTFTALFSVEEIETPIFTSDQPVRKVPTGLADGQPDYRFLLVDDNYTSRSLLKTSLGFLPIHICEVGNGEEALELCHSYDPHVIFMDLRMPGMDGLETARKIREFNSSVVIIAVSASCFEQEHLETTKAGCNVLLRKPYLLSDIFCALEEHSHIEFIYD